MLKSGRRYRRHRRHDFLNHGGRQLDGSTAPFDQLGPIVDAVGDQIELIVDGGVRRGTHVLKALAMGATACMIGRGYLYAVAAGGYAGVDRALTRLREEIERDMILMGCSSLDELDRSKLPRIIPTRLNEALLHPSGAQRHGLSGF